MTERTNPFAGFGEMPAFERKPKSPRAVQSDAIDLIAEQSGFISRQPAKVPKQPKRKPRLHRTGRNVNFSLKATAETRDRFHRLADERDVTLARLLELALDALESNKA